MNAPDDLLEALSPPMCAAEVLARLGEVDEEPFVVRVSDAARRAQAEDARVARLLALGEAVERAKWLVDNVPGAIGEHAYIWNSCLRSIRAAAGVE